MFKQCQKILHRVANKLPPLIASHRQPTRYGSIPYTQLNPVAVLGSQSESRVFHYLDRYITCRSEAIIRIADFIIWTLALALAIVPYFPQGQLTKTLRFLISPLFILISAVGIATDYGFGPRQQILDPKFKLKEEADRLIFWCNQLTHQIDILHKQKLLTEKDSSEWTSKIRTIKNNIDRSVFENLHAEIDHRSRLVTYPGSLIILFSWLQATYQVLDRATGNGRWSADLVIPCINLMLAVFAAVVYWHYYANTLKKANNNWGLLQQSRTHLDQLTDDISKMKIQFITDQHAEITTLKTELEHTKEALENINRTQRTQLASPLQPT